MRIQPIATAPGYNNAVKYLWAGVLTKAQDGLCLPIHRGALNWPTRIWTRTVVFNRALSRFGARDLTFNREAR